MGQAERHQVWLYLAAIGAGLTLGSAFPSIGGVFEVAVWPTLGVLLYVTFSQMPLTHLSTAVRDIRFAVTVLVTNFAVLPLVVWALLPIAPDDPAMRLGVVMVLVLVVPCTDWFLTFTHLAGGDLRRSLAVTPALLVVQLLTLPAYVHVFVGESFAELTGVRTGVTVFITLILVPLVAAWLTQRRAERHEPSRRLLRRLGSFPVPLVATVVFLIAVSQVSIVSDSLGSLPRLSAVFVAFLVAALIIGRALASIVGLDARPARSLIFSAGTRNSFVVLPVALALPDPWAAAAVVVVFQSLVELLGMVGYLWVVPRIVPDHPALQGSAGPRTNPGGPATP